MVYIDDQNDKFLLVNPAQNAIVADAVSPDAGEFADEQMSARVRIS